MYVIAILMGSFEKDHEFLPHELYQAIPLYPALQRIEVNFPAHIRGIRLEAHDSLEGQTFKQSAGNLTKVPESDTGYFGSILPDQSREDASSGPCSAPPQLNTPQHPMVSPTIHPFGEAANNGNDVPNLDQVLHSTPITRESIPQIEAYFESENHSSVTKLPHAGNLLHHTSANVTTAVSGAPPIPPRRKRAKDTTSKPHPVSGSSQTDSATQTQPANQRSNTTSRSPAGSSSQQAGSNSYRSEPNKKAGGPVPSNKRGPVPSI